MPNLGSADGVLVWMVVAMKYGRVSARMNGLAVVPRLRLTPEGRAAWIQSFGCVGSICEGAAAADWVSKHYSMPRFGFRAFFGIGSMDCWMCVASNVMVLSGTEIGAPASSEGT
jgi:hypothetical protein